MKVYLLLLIRTIIYSSCVSRFVWARSFGKVKNRPKLPSAHSRYTHRTFFSVLFVPPRTECFEYRPRYYAYPIMSSEINGEYQKKEDKVFDILQTSMQCIQKNLSDDDTCIEQAIRVLQILAHKANTYEAGSFHDKGIDIRSAIDLSDKNGQLSLLSKTGHNTINSLYQLVYRLRSCQSNSTGKKRKGKGSGGKEWRALQFVVSSSLVQSTLSLEYGDVKGSKNISKRSRAIALITLAIILSFRPSAADPNGDYDALSIQSITKMVSSALLSDLSMHIYDSGLLACGQYQSQSLSEEDLVVYKISRSVVLDLLRFFIHRKHEIVDIQVINKVTHAFGIGERSNNRDKELHGSIAALVEKVFGRRIGDDDSCDIIEDKVVSKDVDAAVLSLVASTKPWSVVEADKLVIIAAEYDLWFAAENICDSAIESVDNLALNLSQCSVAHSTTRSIIDAALGYRQYRRADYFATKYYNFGGPARYAEARYLHACDTISKLVRKRVVPLIDKQVERVDVAVKKVKEDIPMSSKSTKEYSDSLLIEKIPEHVREFSLRRLRASNMNSEALRLARLWNMTYDHDPVAMMEEMRQKKLTFLQWDDEGCPGHSMEADKLPLPLPISEVNELLDKFSILYHGNEEKTIGFDCEWVDDGGVSLLQLSSTKNVLLLDVPALTLTSEGCDALRSTVGKLFSGAIGIKYVVGFSCKEDFARLRASPTVGPNHWFPSHLKLKAYDLRKFITETCNLGSRGSPLGLSAACEHFLGKALDKSEQCSDWSMRPLTLEQREYAALDAWACAAIHVKIAASHQVLPEP